MVNLLFVDLWNVILIKEFSYNFIVECKKELIINDENLKVKYFLICTKVIARLFIILKNFIFLVNRFILISIFFNIEMLLEI